MCCVNDAAQDVADPRAQCWTPDAGFTIHGEWRVAGARSRGHCGRLGATSALPSASSHESRIRMAAVAVAQAAGVNLPSPSSRGSGGGPDGGSDGGSGGLLAVVLPGVVVVLAASAQRPAAAA